MRCARCGNENPEENRFCGMCGATLLAGPAVAETQTQRAAGASPIIPTPVTAPAAPSVPRPVEEPRRAAPPPRDPPTISGPSFLGLNDPAPRKRASLSIDPHAPGSRGIDYLLDDEEEPRGGGAGKFILILIALALAVGFGYLRWKNQGFAWLNTGAHKASAAAQSPGDADTGTPSSSPASSPANSPAPGSPSITPDAQTPAANQPAATQPATTPAQPPSATGPSGNTAANPPGGTAAPSSAAPAKSDNSNAAKAGTPADSDDSGTADDNDTAAAAPKPVKPTAPRDVPAAKPSAAAPKPGRTGDPVGEAQKYLYGKGAPQDCDRGLRILKPAANEANPKAMIQMGALYSAGLCTPRDLPTAYRWFALALRKDPDNMAVQTDLQKLWGEMTQPERQLAIKLSQ